MMTKHQITLNEPEGRMKTATYIEALTAAGMDAKMATAQGKAMEAMIDDTFVTKDALDAKLSELKASIFQAMFFQAVAIIGLTAGFVKLLH